MTNTEAFIRFKTTLQPKGLGEKNMTTFTQILLLILSFFGIIAITALITFIGSLIYIKYKRRVRKKYHYTKPASDYEFSMDKNAADNTDKGSRVDGSSALKDYKR